MEEASKILSERLIVDNYNHYKKSGSPSPVLDQAAQY